MDEEGSRHPAESSRCRQRRRPSQGHRHRHGGEVTREQIFELGEYSPGRKLKGFTRPINRIARQMRNAGEVSAEAINPFLPVYDPTIKGYQQAKRFRVPHAIVKLWNESVDEHDGA